MFPLFGIIRLSQHNYLFHISRGSRDVHVRTCQAYSCLPGHHAAAD